MSKKSFLLLAALVIAGCSSQGPESTILVNPPESGTQIAEDFVGLSYESRMLVPSEEGKYYFSKDNTALVRLFRSLGIKSVRIGGNSVDNPNDPLPSLKDIDEFFGFIKETGAKVIYSVRLKDGDPAYARAVAGHISSNYRDCISHFAIGNEPSYYKDLEGQMRPHWTGIFEAMAEAAPGVPFCAPDDNPNPGLSNWMMDNFGAPEGPVDLLSMHYYPGDCAYTNPFKVNDVSELIPFDPAVKRELLLSDDMHDRYNGVLNKMSSVFSRAEFRLSETNSIWYGGLKDASDSYAATLWALDYMWWWASCGAAGTNFHTGDMVGGGNGTVVSRYALFVSDGDGFEIRPICYAIKAFSDVAAGYMAETLIEGRSGMLSAYACISEGKCTVTLINREHSVDAGPREVEIVLNDSLKAGRKAVVRMLTGPDVAAKDGVTYGGRSIQHDGSWEAGAGTKVKVKGGKIRVVIPPASAATVSIDII